tara:strand:+ start:1239 stop:2465 length:1227 start_codon:yes stop_codon:yes gene_type:complete
VIAHAQNRSARRWTLPHFVIATYALFLTGFYFVPNAVDHYKFYIFAVFFPGLFLLRSTLSQARNSRIWLSVLAYLAYMLLSSTWSDAFSLEMLWRDVRYTAYILSFILITVYLFEYNPRLPQAIMVIVTVVVIIAAIISIVTFQDVLLLPTLTENRLIGVGVIGNSNPSAFVYGFWGVVALDYARRHRGTALGRICAFGVPVIFLYIALCQSNTGILALTAACSLLFFTSYQSGRVPRREMLIGLLLVVGSAIFLAWSLGFLSKTIDAGFLNRLPIWQHVLQLWQQAPILGQGLQKTLVLTPNGDESILNYAHSLFLSSLRDGGVVGLLLLLLVYFFALRSGLKMVLKEGRGLYLCLLLFGVVCVLVDTDQAITRPKELWIILWLPLGCLMAYELGLTGKDSRSLSTT